MYRDYKTDKGPAQNLVFFVNGKKVGVFLLCHL